jgi:AcrR family transcriptional regulator
MVTARAAGAARVPLDRDRVLEEAVALADEEGIDGVSMRRLSARLGVVPMALYKHVADKDDLLAGMIDRIIAGYASAPEDVDWSRAVRERILSARAALLVHPWLRPAIEGAVHRTPAVLGHMDALAGELARGGLSYDLVHHAMHALGHRIWGFTPEAFSGSSSASTEGMPAPSTPEERALLEGMAARFPHIAAIAADAAMRNPGGACDEQEEFEFTLDLLLDSFARLHASGWRSR